MSQEPAGVLTEVLDRKGNAEIYLQGLAKVKYETDPEKLYGAAIKLRVLAQALMGPAGLLTEEGATAPDGDLPVNVSGGSLGGGHLIEATGLARALEVVLQLRGEAGARQLEGVQVGLAQSWRGVPTTSGAVTVLSN